MLRVTDCSLIWLVSAAHIVQDTTSAELFQLRNSYYCIFTVSSDGGKNWQLKLHNKSEANNKKNTNTNSVDSTNAGADGGLGWGVVGCIICTQCNKCE